MIEKYVKGDLLKISDEFIHGDNPEGYAWFAHGCNCCKQMGAGIALQIKHKYPTVYRVDELTDSILGDYSACYMPHNNVWFNLYTQPIPGPHASIEAIKECFKKLNKKFVDLNLKDKSDFKGLYIPLIGCGIGGLVWKDVEKVINEVTPDLKITVVIYEQ